MLTMAFGGATRSPKRLRSVRHSSSRSRVRRTYSTIASRLTSFCGIEAANNNQRLLGSWISGAADALDFPNELANIADAQSPRNRRAMRASLRLASAKPRLAEENLRLHSAAERSLSGLLPRSLCGSCSNHNVTGAWQPSAARSISVCHEHSNRSRNPNLHNLKKDFGRFGSPLMFPTDPANQLRLQHLSLMNDWRNIAAHQGVVPPSGLPALADLQDWRNSCDGLATVLDGSYIIDFGHLLRRQPW